MRRLALLLVALGGGAAAPPGPAASPSPALHTTLDASVPAAADTVAEAPEALVLTFGGLVEASGAAVRLLGPGGLALELEVSRGAAGVRELTAPLPALAPGGYRVEWRVISGDGHPISGDFAFWVRGGAAAGDPLAPPPPPSPAGLPGHEGHGPTGGAPEPPLALTRGAADAALLLLTGLLLFGSFGSGPPAERTRAATRTLAVVAPLLVAAHAWMWTGPVSELDAAPAERLAALGTLFTGRALTAELVFVLLVPWALLLARRARLATVFAVLAVAAGAFAGHPASYTPAVAIPASALHQLAAAAWIGGLLFLVTEAGAQGFVDSARRVSSVALVAALAVAVTGVLQAALLLEALSALFTTSYGRLVLAKVAGLLALLGFGAYHRLRWIPAAVSGERPRPPRSVGAELGLALGVVVLAAFLSHVPPNP